MRWGHGAAGTFFHLCLRCLYYLFVYHSHISCNRKILFVAHMTVRQSKPFIEVWQSLMELNVDPNNPTPCYLPYVTNLTSHQTPHVDVSVMVSMDCQLDGIQDDLGKKPLGMPWGGIILIGLTEMGSPTLNVYGAVTCTQVPDWIKRRTQAEPQNSLVLTGCLTLLHSDLPAMNCVPK